MRKSLIALVCALMLGAASAQAPLPEGALAPDFTLKAALAGRPQTFALRDALRKGPVVLYFFPAAFSAGCTIEAHEFAEASGAFRKLGATVVGVTAGNIDRVANFSKVECRNKFVVAADPDAKVAARYHAKLDLADKALAARTSFVIAPTGKILLVYSNPSPEQHVARTMAAIRAWRGHH
jgi:peroxiredoxin Q/BCP